MVCFLSFEYRKMYKLFYDVSRIATIEHRCVTHLYGSNAIQQSATFPIFILNFLKLKLQIVEDSENSLS